MMGMRASVAIGCLALASAGCSAPPAPTATLRVSASSAAPTPRRTAPQPTSVPTPTISNLRLSYRRVPTDTAAGDITTDGRWIVWVVQDARDRPQIQRWREGMRAPEIVFTSAYPHAAIQATKVAGDRMVFTETRGEGEQVLIWTFWYLDGPASAGRKLATGQGLRDFPALAPQPAMNERYLVYVVQRIESAATYSDLVVMDLRSGARRTIASSRFDSVEYWWPSLDGSRLVYGTVEYDAPHQHDQRHVYLLDLERPSQAPRRLDSDGIAADPVLHGETVVWKLAPTDFNMNNWGDLVRYSISTGRIERLRFAPSPNGFPHNYPSIGNRFVAAELWDSTSISVYDLQTDSELVLEKHSRTGPQVLMRPYVAGDLFVWVSATDASGEKSEIHFVRLPPPNGPV